MSQHAHPRMPLVDLRSLLVNVDTTVDFTHNVFPEDVHRAVNDTSDYGVFC
ncbi:hypothetical protein HYC85_008872 [Camellia sinensis]|uniref:Uncharacterized protein n=1 Tax=Camellia sinensis TaxID=4442 RepID=A0A7J7HVC4_CAMSI|nr:hypothetical protein HYC85_008872 [Camellia sinensis]